MSTQLRFDAVNVGDVLPVLSLPPVNRTDLALYCGASGDHNPIHVDIDYAKAAGMPDVFAHGMLSMGWLARLLTNWAPQTALRQYGVRFVAITHVGDAIRCTGAGAPSREEAKALARSVVGRAQPGRARRPPGAE